MNSKKEIRVFCDFETDVALVRIFKFRSSSWSGGKTYEIKRDSPRMKELSSIISKYRDNFAEGLGLGKDIFWKEKTEKATCYCVDMSIGKVGLKV